MYFVHSCQLCQLLLDFLFTVDVLLKHIKLSDPQYKREKIQALSLAKECYSMKLDLLTNATVVDDVIRFVSSHKSKEKLKTSSDNGEDDKEPKKPDYNEGGDKLGKEQEKETGEIVTTITNEVF
jgi:hypothetical protein